MATSVQETADILEFNNVGEFWFTEIVYYICFLLIWFLFLRILWHFCLAKHSPKCTQHDAHSLKPLKHRAEQSRAKLEPTSSHLHANANGTIASTRYSVAVYRRPTVPSDRDMSHNATRTTPRVKSVTASQAHNKNHNNSDHDQNNSSIQQPQEQKLKSSSSSSSSPSKKTSGITREEFEYQIARIQRTLRLCFLASVLCTLVNITSILLNHTLILIGATDRHCITSRLPTIANFSQRIALYLFFIFRLHFSFGSTQFGIRKRYIIALIAMVVLLASIGMAWFLYTFLSAPDACVSGLVTQAAAVPVAQDFFVNIFLSVLFIVRLRATVSAQYKGGSTINLEVSKMKKARANYKYFYAIYKLTLLFLSALLVTVCSYAILAMTGLAGAMAAIEGVISNYLLFINFQFNDAYFRALYCSCLKLQSRFLGDDYAREMDLYSVKMRNNSAMAKQSTISWHENEAHEPVGDGVEVQNGQNGGGGQDDTLHEHEEHTYTNTDNTHTNDGSDEANAQKMLMNVDIYNGDGVDDDDAMNAHQQTPTPNNNQEDDEEEEDGNVFEMAAQWKSESEVP